MSCFSQLVLDGEGLGSFYDHDMTRLDGSRTEEGRRIVSLNGLLNQVENHLLDRINLQELYSVLDTTLRGNRIRPLFFQPNHVVFSAHRRRFDNEQALIGDRHSYLFREMLDQNDSGRCVWTAMLSQFENAVYKIRYTIEEMQAMTGLGNKVSMQDMSVIEDKVQILWASMRQSLGRWFKCSKMGNQKRKMSVQLLHRVSAGDVDWNVDASEG